MSRKSIISFLNLTILIIAIVSSSIVIFTLNNTEIIFRIKDNFPSGNGKTAKIILLAGQSNASGCSHDEYLKLNVSPEKYQEYEKGYDNIFINYFCSGNNISSEFVKCSNNQGETIGFFGPELGLAEKLNEMYPNELIFIIKYAWGGTNLFEQWLSPSSFGKTGELYNQFINFTQSSINYLISKNYNVNIEGICWMQGESDSFSVKNATDYEKNLKNFIEDTRKIFNKYASNDGIAFIDAFIADNPMYWVFCDLVNNSKQKVASLSKMNIVIDTNAYGLSCSNEPKENIDMAHYDSMSEIQLGHLFAKYISNFFDI